MLTDASASRTVAPMRYVTPWRGGCSTTAALSKRSLTFCGIARSIPRSSTPRSTTQGCPPSRCPGRGVQHELAHHPAQGAGVPDRTRPVGLPGAQEPLCPNQLRTLHGPPAPSGAPDRRTHGRLGAPRQVAARYPRDVGTTIEAPAALHPMVATVRAAYRGPRRVDLRIRARACGAAHLP